MAAPEDEALLPPPVAKSGVPLPAARGVGPSAVIPPARRAFNRDGVCAAIKTGFLIAIR